MAGGASANPLSLNIAQSNNYISQQSTRLGLDPRAVGAVEHEEGGSGRVGDNGTSFGPFQLHQGGALPNNIPLGSAQSWAWSQPGINYALNDMLHVGAGGLKGNNAISTIVSKFERPANAALETANAEAVYGHIAGTSADLTAASPTMSPVGQAQKPMVSGAANSKAIISWALNNSRNLLDGKVGTSISGLTNAIQAGIQNSQPINQLSPTKSLPHDPAIISGSATPLDKKAINLAKEYLGTPYKWGGDQPGGFDCSGLLQYVWSKQGVTIPRTTYDQFKAGQSVSKGALRPGDAVFFKGSDPENGLPGHVGMYIGGGKFIESPTTGSHVMIANLSSRTDYQGARRYG